MWSKFKVTVPPKRTAQETWGAMAGAVIAELGILAEQGWEVDPAFHVEVGIAPGGEKVHYVTFEAQR